MSVEFYLPKERARAIVRPIGEATGLPNATYTDEAYMRLERDLLFARTWTCVGTGSRLPVPGNVVPVELLGLPLVLVRDRAGEIRVFHNVCSHRGMTLVDAPCAVRSAIRCPYHSWTYELDGSLKATPLLGGPGNNDVDGFDRGSHGLKAIRSAVWLDMVFVNLDGQAPDFERHIAPLADRWAGLDLTLIRHGGADSSLSYDVRTNWKLAVDNYCEAYHLPWIHPALNNYSRLEDHYPIVADGRFAGQGSTRYDPRLDEEGIGFPTFPELPDILVQGAEYVALFPNVLLGIHRDHFFSVRLEPVSPDLTSEHMEIYYVGDEPLGDDFARIRDANRKTWDRVFSEDIGVVEGMQRGRASPAFEGGVFSPVMETPTHCFHRWVASTMHDGLDEGGG